MTDNFDYIYHLLNYGEADNVFFHTQVIRRGKDHPDLPAANKVIKQWLVKSEEHLASIKEEIIFLCEHYKARAYINVAPKSIEKLNTLLMSKLAINQYNGNIINPQKVLNSACGELQPIEKRWIVDVDTTDSKARQIVIFAINAIWKEIQHRDSEKDWYISCVPTKNGVHYITRPFNLQKFKESFPTIDVHKNNPTILYVPKSLDNDTRL